MFKRKLKHSDYFLIAVNLLPVIGVWLWNWNAIEIFTVYGLETIIVGFFNLVKMGIVTAVRKKDDWYNQGTKTRVSGLFHMLFFLAHYGIFVAVQLGIFFGVSGLGDYYHINFFNFFFKWPQLISADSAWLLAAFFAGYGYATVRDFIMTREYRTIPMMILMFQPYLRIFIQQIVVIMGSLLLVFGWGKLFITIFALVKSMFELFFNYAGLLRKAGMEINKNSRSSS